MYEYKFIKIDIKTGLLIKEPTEDYHTVIEHYADKGWRLVQIFAPPKLLHGANDYLEIIFEKEIEQ